MKKLLLVSAVIAILLVGGVVLWAKSDKSPLPSQETNNSASYDGKDCGSEISTRGNNRDTIDRNCFIEAYQTCSPAKISRELVDPDNHTITTIIYVDGVKKDNNCQVSIHTENKYKIPENEINYCYKAELGAGGGDVLSGTVLKFDNCNDNKPLFF